MIRIRLEAPSWDERLEGMVWHLNGRPMYRVYVEQCVDGEWQPVPVVMPNGDELPMGKGEEG